MEEFTVVGLDLAKNVFQVHGMNGRGRKLYGARLKRGEVLEHFGKLPATLVGTMAAIAEHFGVHYTTVSRLVKGYEQAQKVGMR